MTIVSVVWESLKTVWPWPPDLGTVSYEFGTRIRVSVEKKNEEANPFDEIIT